MSIAANVFAPSVLIISAKIIDLLKGYPLKALAYVRLLVGFVYIDNS